MICATIGAGNGVTGKWQDYLDDCDPPPFVPQSWEQMKKNALSITEEVKVVFEKQQQ